MNKKKKKNIFKSIILSFCACFIAVFSVFSLVDIPTESKKVSAAAVGEGDIVYNSPNIPFTFSFFPYDISSYDSTTIKSGIGFYNGYIKHSFSYQLGSNATFSLLNSYLPSNTSTSLSSLWAYTNNSSYSPYISGDVSLSNLGTVVFDPLYNFTVKFVLRNGTVISSPSANSFSFLFINISYSYSSTNPFSFDVLDVSINPYSNMVGDYPSPPYSSIVYQYHPIGGNSSNLTIEYSYFNNQLFQGNSTLQRYYLNPNYVSSGGGSADPNAYQNGYDNGYSAGYLEGNNAGLQASQETSYNSGYSTGYDTGYGAGYDIGYDDGNSFGYDSGNRDGYIDGKQDGYNLGVESAHQYTFANLISAVIDVPINTFTSLFNFEILGVNLSGFFLGLLTCCVVIAIAKLLI